LPSKRVGRMLKTLRERRAMSQRDLAKRSKVTQAYIAFLEGGNKKNPSLAVLTRIAKALGVPVTELVK
jgi:transcriptional regulator with XRE-family HTH domain